MTNVVRTSGLRDPLGFWDKNADDMPRQVERVAPRTDRTGPLLPAVGFGRTIRLVSERKVCAAGRTDHGEHRFGRRHFGGSVFSGVETVALGGSSPIHWWVHLSQR